MVQTEEKKAQHEPMFEWPLLINPARALFIDQDQNGTT